MHSRAQPRVYVGVSGSLTGLRALRQAVVEARRRHAELVAVYVRPPARPSGWESDPIPPLTNHFSGAVSREMWGDRAAEQFVRRCFQRALGGIAHDLTVEITVLIDRPHTGLARIAAGDDDLLVVGASKHRRWRHLLRGPVGTYCARHARCPVLVVPLGDFAQDMERRRRLRRLGFHRDPWKQFDATAHDEYASVR